MAALTLMHLANHGSRNVGNAALILGLERVLTEDVPGELVFRPEPWDLYSRGMRQFDEQFVERVNTSCDVLLIGAAVSFDGSGQYARSGFRLDLPLGLWDRIERPIVFYGLSHRVWPRRPYSHLDRLRRALEHILGNDRILFSVRNDGTKEWLESILGRVSERILVVPDPALFVPVDDAWHPELERGTANVLLSLNAEDEPERWGRASRKRTLRRPAGPGLRDRLPITSSWGWREARDRFLRSLATALGRLARERDLNLIVCSHDPLDVGIGYELFGLLPDKVKYRVTFASASLPVDRGRYFYGLYAKADLALSMRIHSMNPAIGLGTPVVPLVSQPRMSAFMTDAGLADLCVDVHAGDVEERVFGAATRAFARPGDIREQLTAARVRLRGRTAAFNHRFAQFVGAAA